MTRARRAALAGTRGGPRDRSEPVRSPRSGWFIRALVAVLLAIELYPLVWMFLQSFKTSEEFNLGSVVGTAPQSLSPNWATAWTPGDIPTYFKNSVLAVVPSLFLIIVLSLAAAFGLEVMQWRLRNGMLLLFLAGILIPMQMLLLPMFTIYYHLHLIDTLWSLIIAYTAFGLPLAIFLMVGYFRAFPREVLEAAMLDGASIYKAFAHGGAADGLGCDLHGGRGAVLLHLERPAAVADIHLDEHTAHDPDGMLNFTGQFGAIEWGPTFAAVCMTILPTLVLYLILNKRVMRGLTGRWREGYTERWRLSALKRRRARYPGADRPAVAALDLEIADGEFLVLVGPSGCGKTTACGWSPGSRSRRRHGARSASGTSPTCRPRTATSRWSSRTTRSTRT